MEDEEEGSYVNDDEEIPSNGDPHDKDGSGDLGIALPDGETDIHVEAFSERNSSADEDFDSIDHDANLLDVSHENNVEHVRHVANGITYSETAPADRRWQQNVISQRPRNLCHPNNEVEAFLLYLSEDLLHVVLRHTNRKVRDILRTTRHSRRYMSQFTYDELLACLGILNRCGSDCDNFNSVDDIWSSENGKPFYRPVLSKHRFNFFLRTIR